MADTMLVATLLTICIGCESAESQRQRMDVSLLEDQLAAVRAHDTTGVYLYDTHHTDDLLKRLEGVPGVQRVSLAQCDVTEAGMKSLSTLPDLRWLSLYSLPVSEEWIALLRSCPRLERLDLKLLASSDAVGALASLPHLRSLTLGFDQEHPEDWPEFILRDLARVSTLQEITLVEIEQSRAQALQSRLPKCRVRVVPNWK